MTHALVLLALFAAWPARAQQVVEPPQWIRADGVVDYGSGGAQQTTPHMAPQVDAIAPVAELGSMWPSAGMRPLEGARNPRRSTRSIAWMQGTGVALLAAGYGVSALGAGFAFGHRGISLGAADGEDATCHDAMGASLLVPVVGGLIALGVYACSVDSYSIWGGVAYRNDDISYTVDEIYAAFAIAGAIAQLGGLAMVIGGSLAREETVDFQAAVGVSPNDGGGLSAWLRVPLDQSQ